MNAARNFLLAGVSAGQPGGDVAVCREEAEQQSVRSGTTGAHRHDTEQYQVCRRAA